MSAIRTIILVTLLVLCAALAAGAQATTVTAGGGSIPAAGQTVNFPITVDSLPEGIAGFNITVSLSDPSKAEIVEILFPSWAPLIPGLVQIGSLPADSVWYVGVDFGNLVTPGATNVNLGTVRVRSDATGTTDLQVALNMFQNEDGNPITASVIPGTIIIGTPTTTPTTVPTTEPTTTVPTTEPTTTVPTTEPTTTVPTTEPTTTVPTTEPTTTVPTTEPTTTVPTTEPTTTVPTTEPTTTVPTTEPTTTVPTTEPTTTVPTTEPTTTVPTTEPTTTVPTTEPTTTVPTTLPTTAPAGFGTVFINSIPTGATVLVDGVDKGTTNIIIPHVPAGLRTFAVMKEGYLTETFTVNVPAGGLATPPKVTLEKGTSPTTPVTTIPTTAPTTTSTTTVPTTSPTTAVPTTTPAPPGTTGSLYVYSIPVGATVHVDGIFRGYGPDIFTGITAGSHALTVSKEGYRTDVRYFNINAGRTTFVPVFLVPDVGLGLLF